MANSHILVGASTNPLQPVVRRISASDLYHALARGYDDFAAFPSHALFLCVIYPLVGILLIGLTFGTLSLLPLAIPIAAGFALVGPVAAIGAPSTSPARTAERATFGTGSMITVPNTGYVVHCPSAIQRMCSSVGIGTRSLLNCARVGIALGPTTKLVRWAAKPKSARPL
jgi:uncharacterized membrane protein